MWFLRPLDTVKLDGELARDSDDGSVAPCGTSRQFCRLGIRVMVPSHALAPPPPAPRPFRGRCRNACYSPTPFAPVQYSRWFADELGTLYVVRYTTVQQ